MPKAIIGIGVTVFVAAPVLLLATGHGDVTGSSDEGATSRPVWAVLIPVLVAMALTRLVPPRAPERPALRNPAGLAAKQLWPLLGCAIVFPLVVGLADLGGTGWYALLKVILLLVVPWQVIRWTVRGRPAYRGAVVVPRERWQWLAPLPAVAAWIYLDQISPLAADQPAADSFPDPVTLVVIATLTLLTASIGEEIFYRFLLQSRLETVYGRWPGILTSAILFGLMHLGTHRADGPWWVSVASVVAIQGSFGLLTGYLWARYRNIWAPIAIHIVINAFAVAVHLVNA